MIIKKNVSSNRLVINKYTGIDIDAIKEANDENFVIAKIMNQDKIKIIP